MGVFKGGRVPYVTEYVIKKCSLQVKAHISKKHIWAAKEKKGKKKESQNRLNETNY